MRLGLVTFLLTFTLAAQADPGLPALTVSSTAEGAQTWSLSLQLLVLMTGLTLLPAALLTMTSFTRIAIVLALLRQALGTQQTPSNQVLIGLALFLTAFVMAPVLERIHERAIVPYLEETISFEQALQAGREPLEAFMLAQTREKDLNTFAQLAGYEEFPSEAEVPFSVLVPSYITSELKTAFQIGFLLFVPFLIIDLVVASVLMAMGMMMLSPLVISFPFKIMLFVLIDGWNLLLGSIASSFYIP